jgi:hypothetical protein
MQGDRRRVGFVIDQEFEACNKKAFFEAKMKTISNKKS